MWVFILIECISTSLTWNQWIVFVFSPFPEPSPCISTSLTWNQWVVFVYSLFPEPSPCISTSLTWNQWVVFVFSPFPEPSPSFSSLFCRTVSASACHLSLKLRDFPHDLLAVDKLCIRGRLIGAEPVGIDRGLSAVFLLYFTLHFVMSAMESFIQINGLQNSEVIGTSLAVIFVSIM